MEPVAPYTHHPLDNPAWASLTGAHAGLAEVRGRAGRYRPDVSVFTAVADAKDEHAWADLAALVGPGGRAVLHGPDVTVPDGWRELRRVAGMQMVGDALEPAPDPETVLLGPSDVPEMVALVERTDPGPFRPGTVELGRYLGIRREGRLIAMAGERMRPPGWTEISAVCTDTAYRGRGLASRLIRAVAHGIVARDDTPFLNVAAENTNAIRLYEALGFTVRTRLSFVGIEAPA